MATLTVSLGAWKPLPSTWRGTMVRPAAVVATVPTNCRRETWLGGCFSSLVIVSSPAPGRPLRAAGWSRLLLRLCRAARRPGARRAHAKCTRARPPRARNHTSAASSPAWSCQAGRTSSYRRSRRAGSPGPTGSCRYRAIISTSKIHGLRNGASNDRRRRRVRAQHLRAALRVVHRQVEGERHGGGEHPAEVVACGLPPDVAAHQHHARAEHELDVRPAAQHGQEVVDGPEAASPGRRRRTRPAARPSRAPRGCRCAPPRPFRGWASAGVS